MQIANTEIARIFRDLADLLEIQGANPHRVRAYRNAARMAEQWPEPLARLAEQGEKALVAIPGLGADLAGKVAEIVRTGSLTLLRTESEKLPAGVLELLRIPGFGPKKVRALYDSLGVTSIEALEEAAREGKVRRVAGFSVKTEAKLLDDLAAMQEAGKRFLRASVSAYAEALLAHLRSINGVGRADIAGSYRRNRDTVGDLDYIVQCDNCDAVIDDFVAYEGVADVVERGATRAKVRLRTGLLVELHAVPEDAYGAGLLLATGSPAHVAELGGGAVRAAREEREIYTALGLPLIPPELREGRGEIEAAREARLPKLLELKDLRGDLQMHTTASDGRNTLQQMAEAAQALGHEYIAITDHTPLLQMIQGLDREGFREQWKAIDKVNATLKTLTVLKGAEVDIHADGTLDLDDETLAELDVVVVSLHSKLSLPPDEQTRRVVKALSHPNVDIMGHPRGRMLLRREGARFDLGEVCKAAADHGVMLEVNAHPNRLDLDDVAVRAALDHGIKLVVSTDAHSTQELENLRWGVDQARRGWARKEDVVNTFALEQFLRTLHKGR